MKAFEQRSDLESLSKLTRGLHLIHSGFGAGQLAEKHPLLCGHRPPVLCN